MGDETSVSRLKMLVISTTIKCILMTSFIDKHPLQFLFKINSKTIISLPIIYFIEKFQCIYT